MFAFVIHPFYIWITVSGLLACSIILVSAIYFYLYKKKKRFFANAHLRERIEEWISNLILDDSLEINSSITIPTFLVQQLKNRSKKQFVINILMESKRQLIGSAAEKIVYIYEQLGFKKASIQKLDHKLWYHKASAIQELYIMEQKDMLDKIYPYVNHHNRYLQHEAQTAVIRFKGFAGLSFLDNLSYSITEWQQMNIMDQLKKFEFVPLPHLKDWLVSQNDAVVLFALKLAVAYQQFQFHDLIIEYCLTHKNEMIRKQTVQTLACMINNDTIDILTKQFVCENETNKINILQQLAHASSDMQQHFLTDCLSEESDVVKLEAAKTLVRCCSNGMAVLSEKAVQQPDPYLNIYLHIKSDRYL